MCSSDLPPFSFDHPSDAILPAYRSVNAGMAFDFDMRPVTVQVRGAILNLFNRRNVYDWSLQEFDGAYEIVPRTLPGRRPALSIKLVY